MTEEMHFRGRFLQFLADMKLLKFFYILTGGFPSKRGMGLDVALKIPLRLLEKGAVILMFPEGRLIREDNLGVFYNGTSALAIRSKAPILPFHIRIGRGNIRMTFGESFSLANPHPVSVEEGTAIIKEKIAALAN